MKASEALKAARAAGVNIKVDGDDLVLEATAAPPSALLDALSYHKASILALLRSVTIGSSAEDWRALFEERTKIFQRDAGLQRDLAEAEALAACIATWLNKNPVTSPAGRCIVCGRGDRPNDVVLPYGTTPPGAAWLHSPCWSTWSRERRDQAVAALAAIGVAGRNPDARHGAGDNAEGAGMTRSLYAAAALAGAPARARPALTGDPAPDCSPHNRAGGHDS